MSFLAMANCYIAEFQFAFSFVVGSILKTKPAMAQGKWRGLFWNDNQLENPRQQDEMRISFRQSDYKAELKNFDKF